METVKTFYRFSRYADADLTLSVRKDENGYHARIWSMVSREWTSGNYQTAEEAERVLNQHAQEYYKVHL